MDGLLKKYFSKNGSSPKLPLTRKRASPRDLLYVSDLDGTLLLSDGTLSHQSIQRLNRMIERGLKFTIATARNYDSVYPILKGLNLQIPVVLFNGVYLTDFPTGRNVFFTDFIARDVVEKMMTLVAPLGLDPFIYTYEDQHRVYYRNAGNPGAQAYLASLEGDGRLRKVKQYEFSALEKISGFLLIDSRKVLKPIYQELQKKYPEELNIYFAQDVSHKGYYWLQAFHQQANKGRMVRLLAQYLKKPLEEVVVFGDYLNDLEMFRIAGHSVAVANALPEVKALAHEVIGSNENGAVIDYLESVCFGN